MQEIVNLQKKMLQVVSDISQRKSELNVFRPLKNRAGALEKGYNGGLDGIAEHEIQQGKVLASAGETIPQSSDRRATPWGSTNLTKADAKIGNNADGPSVVTEHKRNSGLGRLPSWVKGSRSTSDSRALSPAPDETVMQLLKKIERLEERLAEIEKRGGANGDRDISYG